MKMTFIANVPFIEAEVNGKFPMQVLSFLAPHARHGWVLLVASQVGFRNFAVTLRMSLNDSEGPQPLRGWRTSP